MSRVSVIIPALNEAEHITASITSAREGKPHEVIVVDGGSTDETVQLARETGVMVIHSAPGRARQMNAGAARATGNVLLFLHADTLLPRDFMGVVSEPLREREVIAGAFRFKTDGKFFGKWILERAVNLRSNWRQMPYGDQALFLKRCVFEELGSFADLPIMEDYELVCRLRQHGRVVTVRQEVVTSGRRWQHLGLFRTSLLNWRLIFSYQRGQSPEILAESHRRALQR
ncbi:MAG: TIGR04283 family arsenosugar biosynthesis glycosyltransferase [Verrucomicrobia bacterium]|nr:TIGR04283 family arsenosugar biosynthesis glycosyltransferase [Verrucomicrobiota bacterium]MDE3100409.1 TIGR04283 family arsenosugar biosynthesis glycosyltransferase [Verrucomicrobiota bacterium]